MGHNYDTVSTNIDSLREEFPKIRGADLRETITLLASTNLNLRFPIVAVGSFDNLSPDPQFPMIGESHKIGTYLKLIHGTGFVGCHIALSIPY